MWARSLVSPRARLLPGLGARLGRHPDIAASIFVGLRRIPGVRWRASAYRNVSRPLVERMRARLVIPVVGAVRMSVDTSDVVGRVLATSGIWEPNVTAVFLKLLSPGDVCVDVGAHVGYYTLLASKRVGSHGHVYSLEPAATTYAELCANLALNAVSNVTAVCAAAGAADGYGLLCNASSENSGASSVRVPATEEETSLAETRVRVLSLSSVLHSDHLGRLRLVKIDVEGSEVDVVRGLTSLFEAGIRPALIVELHSSSAGDAAQLLLNIAARHDLSVHEIVEAGDLERFSPRVAIRALPPSSGLPSTWEGKHCNLVLIPRREPAQGLLSAFPPS